MFACMPLRINVVKQRKNCISCVHHLFLLDFCIYTSLSGRLLLVYMYLHRLEVGVGPGKGVP